MCAVDSFVCVYVCVHVRMRVSELSTEYQISNIAKTQFGIWGQLIRPGKVEAGKIICQ